MIDPLYILAHFVISILRIIFTLSKELFCYVSAMFQEKEEKKKINFRTLYEAAVKNNPSFWRNAAGGGVAERMGSEAGSPNSSRRTKPAPLFKAFLALKYY